MRRNVLNIFPDDGVKLLEYKNGRLNAARAMNSPNYPPLAYIVAGDSHKLQ